MSSLFRGIQKRVRANESAQRLVAGRSKPEEPRRRPARSRLEAARAAIARQRSPGKHATRELICAENDTENTGRQWVRLRRKLSREDRSRGLAR